MTQPSVPVARGDAGYSLVEVLAAIVILSTAVVALAGALGVAITGSDRHEAQAQVETVLHAAVENVKDPVDTPHVACATTATYDARAQLAAAQAGTPAPTVQITAVQYWDGSNFGTTCYDDAAHNNLSLQLITISVTSAGARDDMTLSFVKT